VIASCCSSTSDSIATKLIGKWVLDSTSSGKGVLYKDSLGGKILIFKDKNHYIFRGWSGDVSNESQGNYFILENPNRKKITISFIPDFQLDKKDTIRDYLNLDIISLSATRLEIIGQTQFIDRRSAPSIILNTSYIYKINK
jgi:hypothetical protein